MSRGDLVPRRRWRLAPILAIALMALAGCGSNSSSSSSGGGGAASGGGATTAAGGASSGGATSTGGGSGGVDISSCGPKPGAKATGSPINLGTINTKQPGTDFTDQASMAQAYFTCVNDNGGVNGHPGQAVRGDRSDQPGPDRRRRQ